MRRALTLAFLFIAGSTGGHAFDRLERAITVARPPPAVAGDVLFSYVGPPKFFLEAQLPPLLLGGQVAGSLARLDEARAATGIDWPGAHAILSLGVSPNTIDHLFGDEELTRDAPAHYARRGFRETREGGFAVFSRFEDNAISLADRNPDDPFGGNFGAAQRIAIRPGHVVATRNWPMLRLALSGLHEPCPHCPLLKPLIAVARERAGPGGRVLAASAHTMISTMALSAQPMADLQSMLNEDPARIAQRLAAQPGFAARAANGLSPFIVSLVIVTRSPAGEAFQVLALYPDAAGAGAAADVLRRRLAVRPRVDMAVTITANAQPVPGGAVAAAIVRFRGNDGIEAARENLFWLQAAITGDGKRPLLNVPD